VSSVGSEYLTTREVAELLRIKERKVYDMASEQLIPCTRATGKLLFSRRAIELWLSTHSSGGEAAVQQLPMCLFAGSHDPLLEWAIRESQCGIPTLFDGSADGLERVANGQATVGAMHIYSPLTKTWNRDAAAERIDNESLVLVNWVKRQRGLIVKPDLNVSGLKDIVNCKTALRQSGAGSQLLLEHLLHEESLALTDLDVALTVRSEADMVLTIASGQADCGLGLESLARLHNLNFIPLLEERFDLLIDRRFWFEPSMQEFINFCNSDVFTAKVAESVGYRADCLFKVVSVFPETDSHKR